MSSINPKERVIMLIDVNSAFLSWEAAYRNAYGLCTKAADLREIPSIVGGDVQKRKGIVLAKSVPAKKYGIKTGDTVGEALRKCPRLTVVRPNYALYSGASDALVSFLREYTPMVEQYSVDESFIDISDSPELCANPIKTGDMLREQIENRFGYTVNVGISSNKLLAKMACEFEKPNRTHTLFPDEIKAKMWPLDVEELFMTGRRTAYHLRECGINTIGELALTEKDYLIRKFKNARGSQLHNYANGVDHSPVTPTRPTIKSIGNSTTVPYDITSRKEAHLVLLSLCEMVGKRLRDNGMQAGSLGIFYKNFEFGHNAKSLKLPYLTQCTQTIYDISRDVFDGMWKQEGIRAIGVYTAQLTSAAARQLMLTGEEEKYGVIEPVIDTLRESFGNDIIMRGGFVNSGLKNIRGGTGDNEFLPRMHSWL